MSASTPTSQLYLSELDLPRSTAKSRLKHMILACFVAAITFLLLLIVIIHAIIAWHLAFPYVPALESNPYEAKELSYDIVVFPSQSKETMVDSWFIPALASGQSTESKQTIILSHGFGANREENWVPMYDLAEHIHDLHYNVLMFDYGYASKAYPAPATWGSEEKEQLIAAVQYAKSRGSDQVIVWGFSMGGGTALQAALESEDIDALILDSLFIPSPDTLYSNIKQIVQIPKYPTTSMISSFLPLWTNHRFSALPSQQILEYDYAMPILIIHGTDDQKADYRIAETIYQNQLHSSAKLWIVEQGQHELIYRKNPNEYMQHITAFLSEFNSY